MPEITEAQLQQALNLDAFVRRALGTPKNRRKILEIQKDLNPDVPVPEIDESDPVRGELRELRDEYRKDREERAENARLDELKRGWSSGQSYAKKRGYSEDEVDAILVRNPRRLLTFV